MVLFLLKLDLFLAEVVRFLLGVIGLKLRVRFIGYFEIKFYFWKCQFQFNRKYGNYHSEIL